MVKNLNLLKNLGAGVWSRGSMVLFRLVQVPLLITALGAENYGRWLVISSLPTWLSFANLGFGNIAGNEMTIAVASDDEIKAKQIFSTTIFVITLLGIVGTLIVSLIVPFIPWNFFLQLSQERYQEVCWAVVWLSISMFVSFFFDCFLAKYRAARKAHIAVMLNSILPWLELVAMMLTLRFTKRLDYLAFSLVTSTIIFFLSFQWYSVKVLPNIIFNFSFIDLKYFKYIFKKGMSFQAFPVGNALLYQGSILIVQTLLGPVYVALYGTARTLVRTVNQGMEVLNQAMWPELTLFFGKNDLLSAAKLHRRGILLSVIISFFGVLFLALFGKYLYSFWVGKQILLSQNLLLLFLLPIPFNAFWFTSSVVQMASNQYEGLAIRYLIATSITTLGCIVLTNFFGIEGAAVSSVIIDLMLIPYVVKKSIHLTNDSWGSFIIGITSDLQKTLTFIKRYRFGEK